VVGDSWNQNGGRHRSIAQEEGSTAASQSLNGAIKIDKRVVRSHLGELVRQSVEETRNTLLAAEKQFRRIMGQQDLWMVEAYLNERAEGQGVARAREPAQPISPEQPAELQRREGSGRRTVTVVPELRVQG